MSIVRVASWSFLALVVIVVLMISTEYLSLNISFKIIETQPGDLHVQLISQQFERNKEYNLRRAMLEKEQINLQNESKDVIDALSDIHHVYVKRVRQPEKSSSDLSRKLFVDKAKTKIDGDSHGGDKQRFAAEMVAQPRWNLTGYRSVLDPSKYLDLQCKNCSLVSSSGHLRRSHLGEKIHNAECIFRMNDAPTRGYSKDVGFWTTVRMISFQSVLAVNEKQASLLEGLSRPKYVVMWVPSSEHTPAEFDRSSAIGNLKALAKRFQKDGIGFFLMAEREMALCDEIYQYETGLNRKESGSWLTTGWFTMILARAVCDEIHVYGMVDEEYCRHGHPKAAPYHYYEPGNKRECDYYKYNEGAVNGGHRFMTEKAVFARWATLKPQIYFHQPEWGLNYTTK